MEDKYIVALFFARDEQAIRLSAERYGGYCHAIAYNILSSREDAEECVNDTYLQAWNSIPPHRPNSLSAFLGRITRRLAVDRVRERTAVKRGGGEINLIFDELADCIADEKTPEHEIVERESAEIINSFLASLPDTERRVFLRRYWFSDSIAAIADRFGFSESKIKSMLLRTRTKLKKHLTEENYYEKF